MMIHTIAKHSKALLKDLEECKADGTWTVTLVQELLRDAGLLALKEIAEAADRHFVNNARHKFQEDLITAGMNFNQRWDTWISSLKPDDLQTSAAKAFHEILLRFSKGAMRYWRIWLIDSEK